MTDSQRTTLHDVARRAGVSTATASHALNGTRAVGAATRTRVQRAARALGYRPSIVARSLKTGSSRLIGCLVNSLSNPFIASAIEGLHTVLRRKGYGVLVYQTGLDPTAVTDGVEFAESYHAAGLVVVHPRAGESVALRRWIASGRGLVLAIHPAPRLGADMVSMAHEEAGYDATRYLVRQGHHRIGVLSRPTRLGVYRLVVAGYCRALREAGLRAERALVRAAERATLPDAQQELGYRETLALLRLRRPPTALVCVHNQIALGALRALRERGISIPKDMSLVSFDDVDWMRVTDPNLTSIGVDGRTLGQVVAQSLLTRLATPSAPPQAVGLRFELVARDSVAPPTSRKE